MPVAAKAPAKLEKDREAQKEEEQAVLDDEMRKRRERVKAWQEEKTKRIAAENAAAAANLSDSSTLRSAIGSDKCLNGGAIDTGDGNLNNALNGGTEGFSATSPTAGWNLEDDDDDGKTEEVSGDADDAEMVLPLFSTASVSNNDTGAFQNLNHADSRMNKKTRKEWSNSISITAIGSPKLDSADQSRGASNIQVSADSVAPSLSATVLLKPGDTPTDVNVKDPILGEVGGSLNAIDEGGVKGADYDPLDDFMSGLYSGGELEEQRSLASDVSQPQALSSSDDKAAHQSDVVKTSSSFGKIVDDSMALVSSESKGEGEGEGEGEENEATATETNTLPDDDYDEYTFLAGDNPTLNPFGSNFITLDQIMGNKTSESGHRDTTSSSSSSGGNARRAAIIGTEYATSGWESDSAPPSPMHSSSSKDYRHGINSGRQGETEEEREEREDKDRKEFIDAIRAARAAEDVVRERSRQKDDAIEKSKEQLGRVFAGEGDVMDETDIEEKKKSALEILEDSKKGKELKPVDHKTVDYIPFRKNLYIVPRALSRLTEDDLNEKREDLQIKVRGKGCPAPVDTWGQCGLSERVLGVLERLGLQAPFAIQKQAIPAIMCGRDLIGVAKTGSGKTLAFLLPMFRHIMDQPPLR